MPLIQLLCMHRTYLIKDISKRPLKYDTDSMYERVGLVRRAFCIITTCSSQSFGRTGRVGWKRTMTRPIYRTMFRFHNRRKAFSFFSTSSSPPKPSSSWERGAKLVKDTDVTNPYLDRVRSEVVDPALQIKTIEDELCAAIGKALGRQGEKVQIAIREMNEAVMASFTDVPLVELKKMVASIPTQIQTPITKQAQNNVSIQIQSSPNALCSSSFEITLYRDAGLTFIMLTETMTLFAIIEKQCQLKKVVRWMS